MCPCLPGAAQRPGKRDLFCPMLPPTPSFPHSQPTNGGDGERRRERWGGRHGGGMRNGLRAVSREGRRCQSHESGDAPPPRHVSFSAIPQYPLLCPFISQSSFLFQSFSQTISPDSAQSAPLPSPGPNSVQ